AAAQDDAAGATSFLMNAAYPAADPTWRDLDVDAAMDTLIEVVRSVRNIRAEMRIAPKIALDLWIAPGAAAEVVSANEALVRRLARVDSLHYQGAAPKGSAICVVAGGELAVPIAQHVDLGAEAERLRRELARVDKELERVGAKLASKNFIERAPEEIVEGERARQAAARQESQTLQASLARVESIGGGL
ncbi:MAG: hypothetical protein HY899_15940, partial [Deltaproteobacteria bacterium]|nr:hypothetical protein [Deltaproteobacteria bacterium]